MKVTKKGTKKFSKAEKLSIIKEAKANGVTKTLSKYGSEGLEHRSVKDRERDIKRLEKENESLKILLAEKELESKLKDEMLKKMYPELRIKC